MRHIFKGVGVGAVLLLTACGAPAANQAASTAASAANQAASALPSGAADQAASAANQAASTAASAANQANASTVNQAASAANQAASALPSGASSAVNQAASALGQAASAASSALAGVAPTNLKLQQNQPLVLSVTSQVAGVNDYRWTIVQAPPGAERVQGTKIAENSDGKLTIDPKDYAKYFPVSGNYVINLDLTGTNGTTNTIPIPLVVP